MLDHETTTRPEAGSGPANKMRADKIRAALHELALGNPEPETLARFYTDALGYAFARDAHGLLGVAAERRLRLVEGQPRTLSYAAFAVQDRGDLAGLTARLAAAGTPVESTQLPGMAEALSFRDPDGNRFVFGLAEPAPTDAVPAEAGGSAAGALGARLQHVVFASTDAARLIDFYADVLGFELSDRVLDDEGGLRTAFLRCSHEHHSLAVFQASECRLDHHCYEAGDWNLIRDWSDHFAQQHIPLKWGPGRHGPGNNLFIFIHDPDGNWLEISAELEHVEPTRPVGDWRHEERTLNSWGIGLLRS